MNILKESMRGLTRFDIIVAVLGAILGIVAIVCLTIFMISVFAWWSLIVIPIVFITASAVVISK